MQVREFTETEHLAKVDHLLLTGVEGLELIDLDSEVCREISDTSLTQ